MKYVFLITLMFFVVVQVNGQEKGWVKLGEKTVAFKTETDKVSLIGNDNTVDKIKLKCIQGTLELNKVTIVMKGGEKKSYDAKALGVMTKGMSSLAYAVPDKDGKISYIELNYDTKGKVALTKMAKVEIWGKQEK
ncbi:DUF2541 domain-containing protein [Echinicola strongylocentroti]|uniref:DUF2541 domain-containing protein n=1 Tax=Echinicola strongylocentroti TaxID=1795355 RepID=A0A2Z4IEV5_9BACT|nr:DUF2541 domain-containing protein [Echinicola strongylocentroti]AWW29621.1 DUF2541 domain-containing protein [Echinicola strongylocentroti]